MINEKKLCEILLRLNREIMSDPKEIKEIFEQTDIKKF